MCSAAIVISHHSPNGEFTYCRGCGGETKINVHNGNTLLSATGRRGTPAQLEPKIETDLVRELVKESARLLGKTSAMPQWH
ncbi:MAG: hypothetical protein R8K20_10835 [Gallionellaceae bacterium]